jgi:hypothetical protein
VGSLSIINIYRTVFSNIYYEDPNFYGGVVYIPCSLELFLRFIDVTFRNISSVRGGGVLFIGVWYLCFLLCCCFLFIISFINIYPKKKKKNWIWNIAGSNVLFEACLFINCETDGSGGCIYIEINALNIHFKNIMFLDNHAGKEGMDIYYAADVPPTVWISDDYNYFDSVCTNCDGKCFIAGTNDLTICFFFFFFFCIIFKFLFFSLLCVYFFCVVIFY